jgi:hypothetical protein
MTLVGQSSADAPDVSTFAAIVTVAVAAAAVAGLMLLRQATAPTRVEAAGATMELGDETPALVDLLTGRFEVDDDAVPATVVDLAQRGWFSIEDIGGHVVIRTRQRRPVDDAATAYEERVLRHIERHAVDGVVPTQVLTLGPEGVSERWFRGFAREVTRHGRSLGLCRRRWDVRHIVMAWVLVGVAFAPATLVASTADRTADPTGWRSVANLAIVVAFGIAAVAAWSAGKISRSDAQVDTPLGREVAARWLAVRNHHRATGDFDDKPAAAVAVWDRHLAYATAMGLARRVQREIPFETEHDHKAWSRATGRWRRVKVRYRAFRPSWGQHPGRVLFEGLLQGAFSVALVVLGFYIAGDDSSFDMLTDEQRRWIGLAGLIVAVVAAAVVAFCLVKVVFGASDLFRRRTVEGEVVRSRIFNANRMLPKTMQRLIRAGSVRHRSTRVYDREAKHQLAIDDGSDDSVVAYVVEPAIYGQVAQGATVRAQVSPLLGYVSAIEVLTPSPRSTASERGVLHPLVEDTVQRAGSKLSGAMGAALARAETMTDDQGRPVLDQRDDDGVTMRERLEQSEGQIDRLRNDPRLAGSPFGQLLDMFLPDSGAEDGDGR